MKGFACQQEVFLSSLALPIRVTSCVCAYLLLLQEKAAGQGIPPHRVGCYRFVSTWTWMYASISGSESNPEQAVALFAERPCQKMKMEARANTRFAGSEFGRNVVADAYPSLI